METQATVSNSVQNDNVNVQANNPKKQSLVSTANGLCFETKAFLQYFLLTVGVTTLLQKIS